MIENVEIIKKSSLQINVNFKSETEGKTFVLELVSATIRTQ